MKREVVFTVATFAVFSTIGLILLNLTQSYACTPPCGGCGACQSCVGGSCQNDCDPSIGFPCFNRQCALSGPGMTPNTSTYPDKNQVANDTNQNTQPAKGADPVVLRTGEYHLTVRDFVIPGRVLPIEIVRTYRTQSEFYSPFGYGWDLNYNRRIIKMPDSNTLVLSNGSGSVLRYTRTEVGDPNIYVSPNGYFNHILEYSAGNFILVEKNYEKSFFNSQGNLTEIQDRTGNNSMTFTYDARGRLWQITNDLGRQITFSYYSNRWTITDFANRTWTYSYGSNNDLHSVTDPNGLVTTYSYFLHNLTSITDPNGQTWLENTYANNKVTTQRYGNDGDNFHNIYDPCNSRTTVTDRRDVNTITVYNSAGLALSETTYTFNPKLRPDDPPSYATRYEYDSGMNLSKKIMPGGNYLSYDYDDSGNLMELTLEPNNGDAPGITVSFTYNTQYNFVQTATDAKGNVTTYQYDDATGNLESITYPEVNVINSSGTLVQDSPVVTFTYNSYGQVETMTAPDNVVTKYEYYGGSSADQNYGRLKKIIADYDGLNIATEFKYDILGNVIEANDPNGNITQFAYNVLGKIRQITDPCNYVTSFSYNNTKQLSFIQRPIGDTNQTASFNYDILDNVKEITNPLGYVTKYSYDKGENRSDVNDAEENNTHYDYDERGLLWKVTDANGGITEFGYTLNGDLNDINDAKGSKTRYEYDRYNRLVKIIYADGSYEQFAYDVSNNVTNWTNRNNQTICYKYDALNRLVDKKRPNEPNIIFRYDIAGRLVDVNDGRAVSEGGGITRYKYDRIGRVSEVNDISGKIVKYEYNSRGLRTKLTCPDNSYVNYEYDAMSRLAKVKYNSSTVATYTYDQLGRRTLLKYGNDTNVVYQYDIGNQLKRLTNNISTTEKIDFNYADYDKAGNRLSCKEGTVNKQIYDYDKLYQLTFVDYNNGNKTWYDYDKLGNRAKMTYNTTNTLYDSNALNQYRTVDGNSYTYDKNGNLTYDGTYKYYYDVENRLTEVNDTGNQLVVTYKYNFAGRRTRKTETGGKTAVFCYDGDQVLVDYSSAGILQRKYVFGPGIDEPICMVSSGKTYYYHYDGLGNVVALTYKGVTYTSITASGYHNLALKSNGSIAEWGSHDYGEDDVPSGYNYVAVAVGWWHSLALKSDGTIVCWGRNDSWQATPPAGNDFVAIAGGGYHSLALKGDGSIVGWGSNSSGQATPPGGNNYVAIAAGGYHSIALKSDGSIACWGDNSSGQCDYPGGNDFVAISAGYSHSLALKADGSIIRWGTPPPPCTCFGHPCTQNPPTGNNFVAIAAGSSHSLAINSNGTLVPWGDDSSGQEDIPSGSNYIAVAAGFTHSVALKSTGGISAWGGSGYYGQSDEPSGGATSSLIVESYSYDVYGKPTIKAPNGTTRTTSAFGNRFMFTGREYDSETSNYYYRVRYYSPKIGRFLQTDPIGYYDSMNLYRYCRNNPLNWTDPWGLLSVVSPEGAGALGYATEMLGNPAAQAAAARAAAAATVATSPWWGARLWNWMMGNTSSSDKQKGKSDSSSSDKKCPNRSTKDKYDDLKNNPDNWEKDGPPRSEPRTGGEGKSTTQDYINKNTGERIGEHTLEGGKPPKAPHPHPYEPTP